MMKHRQVRSLALSLVLATGVGCGAVSDGEAVGEVTGAVLGTDTFLYLLCNGTSWNTNNVSRFVEVAPGSGMFSVSYDINQDWLVQSPDSCSLVETNQLNGWGTQQTRYAFRSGQSSLVVVPDARALAVAPSSNFQVRYPAKGRYTASANWHNGTFQIAATPLVTVEPQRSLIERNEAALTQFSVAETLARIASNGNLTAPAGVGWHDALFKTQARASSFPPGDPGPFCDSNGFPAQVNGFQVGCAGNTAPLRGQIGVWEALSVANRFDLAPTGGENCGEARASFYLPPGILPGPAPQRAFMIFEAVVPNPQQQLGLDGCRPLQAFWKSLSDIADPAARGAKLAQAFYTGEPSLTAAGFKPFFTFENFGLNRGRVRTEAFGGTIPFWDFREFRLNADGGARQMPVAQSLPPQILFTHPKAAQCRTELLDTLGTLMPGNFNSLGTNISSACFDGASSNFGFRFEDGVALPENSDFAAALQARAAQLAPSANLTAVQIGARAQFGGTCVGCHFTPGGQPASRDLGQGLTLPVVNVLPSDQADDVTFTHVNNLRTEPCATQGADSLQTCFKLSPVLGGIFLPHRKTVLESYLNTPVGTFQPGTNSALTIGGTPNARSH